MTSLSDLSLPQLSAQLVRWGFKQSHAAKLVRDHYATGGGIDWEGRLYPKELRERLEKDYALSSAKEVLRQEADDGTTKALLGLTDGKTVEAVLMPDYREDRAAGCISSQVGCAMGCDFCATTKTGFERNLTAGEMVDQFLALKRLAMAKARRLQTVVFMGMGEPLLNYEAVVEAVERIASNDYGALGWRQVTVSTVGIVPGIERLARSGLKVHLAVSLHAPDDETRSRILPMGRKFSASEVVLAADAYEKTTGRPVIIQYCLLEGVNDSLEQASLLAHLVSGRRMHVNLLRYNPTGLSLQGRVYQGTGDAHANAFMEVLRKAGVVAHFRRSRGKDIDAACGQLRRRHEA